VDVSSVVALAAGGMYSLALRSDGLVFASGDNTKGQLGVNSTVSKKTYVQAVSP
jgi:alpha-tubulin suppressor-like RCC1 family protein